MLTRRCLGRRTTLALALACLVSGCESPTEPEVSPAEAGEESPIPGRAAAPTTTTLGSTPPPSPLIGVFDRYVTTAGDPLAVEAPGLKANDIHLDGTGFVLNSFTQPAHGRITRIVTSGAFTYEPDAGFVGADAFTYTLRDVDGDLSAPVRVTIEVLSDPNRPPTPRPDAFGTLMNVDLAIEAPGLSMNDLDLDGDAFVLNSFTQPANGTITRIVTSGAFTYRPDPGFVGSDAFTYVSRDARGALSEPTTVGIEVLAPGGEDPLGFPDDYATTVGMSLAIEAPGLKTNDLDPDGDGFVLNSFTQPAHGRITRIVTSGAFTYESEAGFVGSDAFTYVLRDAEGNLSDPVDVAIEVLPDPNRPPTTVPDAFATLMDMPLAIEAPGLSANDLDLDGDGSVLNSFTQPRFGKITRIVTSGAFTYEPAPGFTGTDVFTYVSRDEHGALSEPTTVIVQVPTAPRPPPEIVVGPDPLVLSPPDHRYRTLRVRDLVLEVRGNPDLTLEDVVITRVTSDEPERGDDDRTHRDIVIARSCRAVHLRAEGQGTGNGRVYVVELAILDTSGNLGTTTVEVHVPIGADPTAVTDAPAQLVEGPCAP